MMIETASPQEFIERTKYIISQYDKAFCMSSHPYEVTMLVNSCVGLLFIAHEKYNNSPFLRRSFSTLNLPCKIVSNYMTKKGSKEPETISTVLRHLRNSIAHGNFQFTNDKQTKTISTIIFNDYDSKNSYSFQIEMRYWDLKTFAMAIAEDVINAISKQNVARQGHQKMQ